MKWKQYSGLCFIIGVVVRVECARILAVYPVPSISHQLVFRKLTMDLIKCGHEVTVITADPAFKKNEAPVNLTEIDLHDISYRLLLNILKKEPILGNNNGYDFTMVNDRIAFQIFQTQINTPEVQNLISNKINKFDLLLIEGIMPHFMVLSHLYKVPVILVSSFGLTLANNDVVGLPSHAIYYPSLYVSRIYNLTLFEKISNIYNFFLAKYAGYIATQNTSKAIRKIFGPDIPPLEELYNNVDMFFVNMHSIWVDNQPAPPNVVFLGGLHQLPPKKLPKDLNAYLDSSTSGVIYVSFGTNVQSTMFPPEVLKSITKVLSQMPYNILWKWDKDELPIKSKNFKLSKWLPQADLLRHPNLKLFITQAGLQSTDETINAGVPVVAIPFVWDQCYNAEKYVRHGIGIKLALENFNENLFKESVEKVINDESYRLNIQKLRKIMYDRPKNSSEQAVWWVDYVIRNGGAKHLRAAAANVSWSQYYEINILLLVFVASIISITIFLILLRFVVKYLSGLLLHISKNKIKEM